MTSALWTRFAAALALALVFACLGCSGSEDPPTAPTPPTPPTPNSPINAVRLLEWCWEQRQELHYQSLLTADFAFVFAPGDSAGDHFPGRTLDRTQELAAANAIFVTGGGGLPAASAIRLDLGATPIATPDPRPGKHPFWHQTVDVRFDLAIETSHVHYRLLGGSTFYLVRGDSAMVPLESAATADSSQWFLERWEERPTITAIPADLKQAAPSRGTGGSVTWGILKWLYLGSPAGTFARPQALTLVPRLP